MSAFKSASAYNRFARQVSRSERYVRGMEAEDFLSTLLREAKTRVQRVPKGATWCRAQLGSGWEPLYQDDQYIDEIPCPHPPARMKPLRDRAVEGRANPKGIPYLYLCTRVATAIAEVRPWLQALVSVGVFRTVKELNIVNFETDEKPRRFLMRGVPEEDWDKAVWSDVDQAFAAPVTRTDDVADYAPTQIIAELFKASGYDGIAYRSSLGPGHNIVLFDLDTAYLRSCQLHEVKQINVEASECANPYQTKEAAEADKAEAAAMSASPPP